MLTRTLGILFCAIVVALVAALLFRPASVLGVSGKSLGNSVGRQVKGSPAACAASDPGWRCRLSGEEFPGVEYAVRMKKWGCWSGTKVRQPTGAHVPPAAISSCIRITDLFGS